MLICSTYPSIPTRPVFPSSAADALQTQRISHLPRNFPIPNFTTAPRYHKVMQSDPVPHSALRQFPLFLLHNQSLSILKSELSCSLTRRHKPIKPSCYNP
ncbi:hypothetical protein EYC80_002383 [Monilinia laxa]|uniref:Uncharacterized protein n=1 Tax=Monilinia laxa TaxID=61186 RepID=A0A5N6K3Q7_MONLA|nr:hypothetical protein EYC80_002383 [Monilinia laxa]